MILKTILTSTIVIGIIGLFVNAGQPREPMTMAEASGNAFFWLIVIYALWDLK